MERIITIMEISGIIVEISGTIVENDPQLW